MPIETVAVTQHQVQLVLATREGHFADLKALEIAPAKLTRSLSAFANADGGELYIGIDETGPTRAWRGFSDPEDANGHLQIFDQLFPLGDGFAYEFLEATGESGLVLHIAAFKSREIKTASDGIPYVRRGAQNSPVTTAGALEILKRNKGITSFETSTVNAPKNLITNSEAVIGFMLNVVPSAEPEPWLKKQLLILDDKPTVAGVLLFADEPQAVLPKRSAIKIYRYKTSEKAGTRETLAFDPITVEGCLYEQIKSAVATTVKLIEGVQVLGPKGLETVTYPFVTLHEIITNAVLHRDYGATDDVHVRIFDNRVEVENPGRLPGHVTVQNILSERFARNGAVVRLINKFPDPPNKDVGEGLNTAFDAMKQIQLKEPQIIEGDASVLCVIRHERLGSPEELIMQYLSAHDEINNSKAREITYIGSENKVKRIFEGLMRAGQIERVPGRRGRATAYRKPLAIVRLDR